MQQSGIFLSELPYRLRLCELEKSLARHVPCDVYSREKREKETIQAPNATFKCGVGLMCVVNSCEVPFSSYLRCLERYSHVGRSEKE